MGTLIEENIQKFMSEPNHMPIELQKKYEKLLLNEFLYKVKKLGNERRDLVLKVIPFEKLCSYDEHIKVVIGKYWN